MEHILKSIENALEEKNLYAALILSLILPDICGKMENPDKSSTERSANWFDKYLGKVYEDFLTGHDYYALRCSLLHEGHGNIYERTAKESQLEKDILDRFIFHSGSSHRIRISGCQFGDSDSDGKDNLILSVDVFCKDIMKAARQWLSDMSAVKQDVARILEIHPKGFSVGGIRIE